jgi:NAD(P)-dependent dehydrogenase (short-subunit alcohol dehydrogenase family)
VPTKLDRSVAAVITGGAPDLGAATARRLAASGVKVALFDLHATLGQALAAELGGLFCAVGVTSEASVDAGFAAARAAHGQERILVNCAGTGDAAKTASRDKATGALGAMVTAELAKWRQLVETAHIEIVN